MIDNRQEQARRYLLGQMSEEEAAQFEAQYFVDDNLLEEMTGLEDEMLDSFVRGELSSKDADKFQKEYLTSPARQAKAGFARTLAGHLSGSARTSTDLPQPFLHKVTPFKFFLAIAASLLIIGSLVFANFRLRHELEQLRTQQVELQRREQDLRKQFSHPSPVVIAPAAAPERQESTVASLILSPGMARSADSPNVLRTSSNTVTAQLQLLVEHDDYSAYSASVETAEGTLVWHKDGLTTQAMSGARAITIRLPLKILSNRNYRVRLTGTKADGSAEDVADYSFLTMKH